MQLSLQDAVNNVSSVNEYIKNTVAEVKQQHNMKETAATNGPEGTVSKKKTGIVGTPGTRDETTTR